MPQLNGEGNVLLTNDMIAQQALLLLKNALVAAPLVWRNLEQEFGNIGDTINVRLPPRVKSAEGRRLQIQPHADQVVPFEIDRHRHVGLSFTQRDRALSMTAFSDRYLNSGMVQIANVIDRSILSEFNKGFFRSGTAGTAMNVAAIHNAEAYQSLVGVPMDGMNCGILHPLDRSTISTEIATKYNEKMVKTALQRGYMGPLSNYDLYGSANLPLHTVGAHGGTPLVNGADQSGSSLITDGWTNSAAILNVGDTFTLAGVYEINPQSYASTGRLQAFTVTAAATADGSGNATLAISPAMNDGSLTTVDENGDTVSLRAYQNVDALPANNAAITVTGTASTSYRMAHFFHKEAVALAMVELPPAEGAVISVTKRDPDTGLAISMTGGYDINNHMSITRLDAVWGTHLIYPELTHKVYSDNM